MATTTLSPDVTDDGWGGALSYLWAQLSGPDTATIADPTSLETDVDFPDVTGTYIFAITVSRDDDALVGTAVWGVTVFGSDVASPDATVGDVVLTANGVEKLSLINSVRTSKPLNGVNTCQWSMMGDPIAVFNEVVLTRGAVRLFGGVCLSLQVTYDEGIATYQPSCVGYAWHLGRARVTRTYTNWDLGSIARDLLSRAPGGITPDFVATGLPVASISFDDVAIDAALTTLAGLRRDLHWLVDDVKRLHFTTMEPSGDPQAIDGSHPTLRDLTVTFDGSQVVNRVRVYYTTPVPEPEDADQTAAPPAPIVGEVQPGDTEIQVQSLDGYSPAGGSLLLNGSLLTYTGTRSGLIDSVVPVAIGYLTRQAVMTEHGRLPPSGTPYGYSATFATAEGETPAVVTFSAVGIVEDISNAIEIALFRLLGEPAAVKRITAVNLYRTSTVGDDPPHAGDSDATFFVGSVGPRGGIFIDAIPKADLAPIQPIPTVNTADVLGYWLTGVTITKPIAPGTPVKTYVEVQDTGAQSIVALALGGGSGVIAISLQGGTITEAQARALATSFLLGSTAVQIALGGSVEDDLAQPGQSLPIRLPDLAVATSLKIQQSGISGFEVGIPHRLTISAAAERVTLENLLKDRA